MTIGGRSPDDEHDDDRVPYTRRDRHSRESDGERLVRVEEKIGALSRTVDRGFVDLKSKVDGVTSKFAEVSDLDNRVTKIEERIVPMQRAYNGLLALVGSAVVMALIYLVINRGATP